MQMTLSSNVSGVRSAARACSARRPSASRTPLRCRAELTSSGAREIPEWVPEPVVPALSFLEANNVKLEETGFYKQYLSQIAENPWVQESTGWKIIPESINSRAAMLGFVAGAGAEIFGAGPILGQLSASPQPVLFLIALLTAATIIPIQKGTDGQYLESLQDTNGVPKGWFTPAKERAHGRLAMLGLTSMIVLELIFGHAVL